MNKKIFLCFAICFSGAAQAASSCNMEAIATEIKARETAVLKTKVLADNWEKAAAGINIGTAGSEAEKAFINLGTALIGNYKSAQGDLKIFHDMIKSSSCNK